MERSSQWQLVQCGPLSGDQDGTSRVSGLEMGQVRHRCRKEGEPYHTTQTIGSCLYVLAKKIKTVVITVNIFCGLTLCQGFL